EPGGPHPGPERGWETRMVDTMRGLGYAMSLMVVALRPGDRLFGVLARVNMAGAFGLRGVERSGRVVGSVRAVHRATPALFEVPLLAAIRGGRGFSRPAGGGCVGAAA